MNPEEIEAVTFDAAGTLIHLVDSVGAHYHRVASTHGIDSTPDALDRAFGVVWKATPLAFSEESHVADPNEKEWWRRIVRAVFKEAGATLPERESFDLFFEALYDHFESPGTWEAAPDARAVVDTVASRYRCAVLSNFDSRLKRILEELDLLSPFEAVFLSCEIGASKPDPRIFRAASDGLQVAPAAILHVGDDPECDWRGATTAGFHHFRVGKGGSPLVGLIDELSLA